MGWEAALLKDSLGDGLSEYFDARLSNWFRDFVRQRSIKLLQKNINTEERLCKIHKDNPEKIYEISIVE